MDKLVNMILKIKKFMLFVSQTVKDQFFYIKLQ